ncbi:hypothetical protein J6590_061786 [Homalodisca vitripennis]|nr:hypothetical protein J6590_061786 [Homalodisca vitripennis]
MNILFKLRIAQIFIFEKTVPERESDSESNAEGKRQRGRFRRLSLPLQENKVKGAIHFPRAMNPKDAQRFRNPSSSGNIGKDLVSIQVVVGYTLTSNHQMKTGNVGGAEPREQPLKSEHVMQLLFRNNDFTPLSEHGNITSEL